MSYTMGEAAKAVGVSKPTLSRAIRKGALSATRLDDRSFQIDPAELERWRCSNGHRNGSVTRIKTPHEIPETSSVTPSEDAETVLLRQRVEAAEAERERERGQLTDRIEHLERRLDEEREERRRLTVLLTDQRQTVVQAEPERPRGFWARLVGAA